MKLISKPKVYLVSKPTVDWEQVAAFLADEEVPGIPDSIRAGDDDSNAIIEISARLCYMSYGRGRRDIEEFINNLLSSKDGSVFEHVNYGFVFTGVSRSLTHELVRHRAGFAYSQRSQRYVDEKEGAFVIPPALVMENGRADEANKILEDALQSASESYNMLVEKLEDILPRENFETATDRRKAVRSAARSVLPNATETKIFTTANVRSWRHFIEMRGAIYADWEIRYLALEILDLLQKEVPLLFGDFQISDLPDGTRIAVPEYSKV
ncbi:MAG: FAD-dependent thymidylate synthase [SAR202 cluster bacterium]|jgi:thymidylate synthase (FAD)|nr:FAD-dependent thymidylate synthase [SAR202 cluster bacterium]MDP6716475.1 FAD-dependent thymidylate synthase [SAR202 cluster bacterium]